MLRGHLLLHDQTVVFRKTLIAFKFKGIYDRGEETTNYAVATAADSSTR
jgi:hypothetical protein